MDADKIAELAVAALTQVANSSTSDLDNENSENIFSIIKERFAKETDSYANLILQQFLQKPSARQAALKEVMDELLIQDSIFKQNLSDALTSAQKNSDAKFSTKVTGGNVGQIMNIDTMHGDLVIGEKASGRTSITGNRNRLDKSNTTYDQRGQEIKGDQSNIAGDMKQGA